jgi:hypothetical protein
MHQHAKHRNQGRAKIPVSKQILGIDDLEEALKKAFDNLDQRLASISEGQKKILDQAPKEMKVTMSSGQPQELDTYSPSLVKRVEALSESVFKGFAGLITRVANLEICQEKKTEPPRLGVLERKWERLEKHMLEHGSNNWNCRHLYEDCQILSAILLGLVESIQGTREPKGLAPLQDYANSVHQKLKNYTMGLSETKYKVHHVYGGVIRDPETPNA